jgi:biofilm protein TabA
MIVDELKNCALYASLNPGFAKAFEFLTTNDLATLPLGKVVLEEDNMWVNIVEIKGNTEENIKMEVHRNFIDIQVPLTKTERFGWKSLGALSTISEPYTPETDCEFYSDKATLFLELQPMEFAIFFPQDGHQPGIVEGPHKKIIVKVRV